MVSESVVSRLRSFMKPFCKLISSKMRPYGMPIASVSLNFESRADWSSNEWSTRWNVVILDRLSSIWMYLAKSFKSPWIDSSDRKKRRKKYRMNKTNDKCRWFVCTFVQNEDSHLIWRYFPMQTHFAEITSINGIKNGFCIKRNFINSIMDRAPWSFIRLYLLLPPPMS